MCHYLCIQVWVFIPIMKLDLVHRAWHVKTPNRFKTCTQSIVEKYSGEMGYILRIHCL